MISQQNICRLIVILGLWAVSAVFSQPTNGFEQRILNGRDVPTGKYPWIVSVRVDNIHVCTGAILTKRFIITAGHCVSENGANSIEASRVTVRAGSINQFLGGQVVAAKKLIIHNSYANFLNDLAIIELNVALEYNENVDKITLQDESTILPDGDHLLVAGWGLIQNGRVSQKLKETSMTVMNSKECNTMAGFGYESTICMRHNEGNGICRGDDGAPVVAKGRLVGIVSFAFGTCGTAYPDIATSISYFNTWINNVIA